MSTAEIDDFYAEPIEFDSGDSLLERGRYRLPTTNGMDGKSHLHTRVTTIAGALPDTTGLGIWQSDRVAWAMAQRPDLCALLRSVPLDDVATIREVRAKAEIIAQADEGSNFGSAVHNVLAQVDRDGMTPRANTDCFTQIVVNYQAKLAEYGLTVLPEYVERVVRMRVYDIAGRLDNIYRESDGTLVLADKKTKGKIDSVHDVATQLSIYANADEMYDEVAGRYEAMPPVRRDYALMIHVNYETAEVTIRKVDIRRGLWSVEVAVNARAWRKMTHLATPYVMPGPVKPADAQTAQSVDVAAWADRDAAIHGYTQPVSNGQPEQGAGRGLLPAPPVSNGHGTPNPTFVAEVANAVLDEAHARRGSVEPHGVVIPDPRSFGAPASVPAVAPYVPPAKPAPGIDPETEAQEIAKSYKAKADLQAYARRYGITDLNHHKIHIATSIVKVRNDRRAAGLDPEPDGDEPAAKINSSASNGGESTRHPQTMAEAGFTAPAPASPPGTPVITAERIKDLTEQSVLADIAIAKTPERLGQIWQHWTDTYGPGSWSGNVAAAGAAKHAELLAGPVAGAVECPF